MCRVTVAAGAAFAALLWGYGEAERRGRLLGRPPTPGRAGSLPWASASTRRAHPLPLGERGLHAQGRSAPGFFLGGRLWCSLKLSRPSFPMACFSVVRRVRGGAVGLPPSLVSHRELRGAGTRALPQSPKQQTALHLRFGALPRERRAPLPGRSGLTKRDASTLLRASLSALVFPRTSFSPEHVVAVNSGLGCLALVPGPCFQSA